MQSPGSSTQGTGGANGAASAENVARIGQVADAGSYQAAFSTARRDGTIQATLIRAGVVEHPVSGRPTVAALLRGNTVKLRNLRRIPRATVLFRAANQWVTVEGSTSLIGPEDAADGYDFGGFHDLRRAVYRAAGGAPESWEAWDRLMDEERRALVFVDLERVYSNQTRPTL